MRYSQIWPRYAAYWDRMQIRSDRETEITKCAQSAMANRDTYVRIQTATGIPWPMLAAIHWRESDADFRTYFGNGQSLDRVTTEVPRGRGPFRGPDAFFNGAVDAIRIEGWNTITDWRLEKQLYYTLLFNGIGTEAFSHPSSYVWGGTNIQLHGKYVRDHVYDPDYWDTQPGTAAIMFMIAKLDPVNVTFTRETS
jgi:lysozyme family protein